MKNQSLYEMRRQLEALKRECQQFIAERQAETEALRTSRPSITPAHQTISDRSPAPTPTPAPPAKQWRFTTGENGQIPEALARRAATDPALLEAIAAEIEERAGHES